MRNLERRVALASQEKVERNARDHVGEQSIGHVGRCFRQCKSKLLQSSVGIARLYFLFAEHRVRDYEQFVRSRHGC